MSGDQAVFTVVVDDSCGTMIAYAVRASTNLIACSTALRVYNAHRDGGAVLLCMVGAVVFAPLSHDVGGTLPIVVQLCADEDSS